ncbi:phosphodiester glycosidase family protein [Hyphococcus flavus]|uniref:Phosphodiester glycosidase family protein n=1 Tax=Hyphococcus flavus TaxID=1866326 RepID=A0AAF0CC18_9PROT|nr:phosphodiester glycosidase family protein [Hyphococcus flavus]WDI32365.1 phosphodiester glycosidase family protein [Hyphococcus flavus]
MSFIITLVCGVTPVAADEACTQTTHDQIDYVVCRFDPQRDDIRLFLNNDDGEPYGHFNWVNEALAKKGETLVFAMNAGMYHEDRSPVGLYVGAEQKAGEIKYLLNENDGPGNFHLKPNGVFYVTGRGDAAIQETQKFKGVCGQLFRYATQSGPMLVIDNEIHPRFLSDSDSLKRRNGVGVTENGEVIFALADTPVRFYDFAMFFRDELNTPNALYLDGTISRLYAPELNRNDPGVAMGPIVGVVVKND